jgi:hypothetical protein
MAAVKGGNALGPLVFGIESAKFHREVEQLRFKCRLEVIIDLLFTGSDSLREQRINRRCS